MLYFIATFKHFFNSQVRFRIQIKISLGYDRKKAKTGHFTQLFD